MRNFRQNRGVFSLFMLIGLAVIVAAIMLLWNYLIPSIIGWTTINYWQALGLFVLTRLLFGGFRKTRTFTPFMGESQKYVSGRTPELYPSTI